MEFAAGMNAAVATVVTKARLGFHNGRSGMINRRSNEGGRTRQFMGELCHRVHMNLYLNLHLINVFLTVLYLKVMRM